MHFPEAFAETGGRAGTSWLRKTKLQCLLFACRPVVANTIPTCLTRHTTTQSLCGLTAKRNIYSAAAASLHNDTHNPRR